MNGFSYKLREAVDLLDLWGINSEDDIKKCYRKKVKEHHPDVQSGDPKAVRRANSMMGKINNAKDLIYNYVDLYGINALIIFISKTRNRNSAPNIADITNTAAVIDSSMAMPAIITEESYYKTISKVIRGIEQALYKEREKRKQLYEAIKNAEEKLECFGELVIDIPKYLTNLDKLFECNWDKIPVSIVPSMLGRAYTVQTMDGNKLFSIEKRNSYVEYLVAQGEIALDKAVVIRGGRQKSSTGDFYYRKNDILKLCFRKSNSGPFNCAGEIKKIISGLEYQSKEFYRYSKEAPFYQYQTKMFDNNEHMMDFLFPHHREIVPSSKRLGMFFCRYDGKSLLYTPSGIEKEYYEEINNSQEVFREIVEIMGILSPIARQLTPQFAEKYIATRGKCHYHVGANIITVLTFKKTKGVHSGLSIRFYLNSGSVCLYDLPGDSDKEAEIEERLKKLKNIGPKMAQKLCSIGIESKEDLDANSTEEIIFKLINTGVNVDYSFAYSIEGAKLGLMTSSISKERKKKIRKYLESQMDLLTNEV